MSKEKKGTPKRENNETTTNITYQGVRNNDRNEIEEERDREPNRRITTPQEETFGCSTPNAELDIRSFERDTTGITLNMNNINNTNNNKKNGNSIKRENTKIIKNLDNNNINETETVNTNTDQNINIRAKEEHTNALTDTDSSKKLSRKDKDNNNGQKRRQRSSTSLGDEFLALELTPHTGSSSSSSSNDQSNTNKRRDGMITRSDLWNNFSTDSYNSSAMKEKSDTNTNEEEHFYKKSHKKTTSSLNFLGGLFAYPFYRHKRCSSSQSNISIDSLGEEEDRGAEAVDYSSLYKTKTYEIDDRESMDSHNSISILEGLKLRIIHVPKWKYRIMVGTILFLLFLLIFSSICSVIYGYGLKMPFFEMKNQRITSYSIDEETKGVSIAFSIDIKISNYNPFPIYLYNLRSNTFFNEEKEYLLATGSLDKLNVHSDASAKGVLVLDFENLNLRSDGQVLLKERREKRYSMIYSSTVIPFTVNVLGFIPCRRTYYIMCTTILIWDDTGNAASECQTEIGKGFIYNTNPASFEPMPSPPLESVSFPDLEKQLLEPFDRL